VQWLRWNDLYIAPYHSGVLFDELASESIVIEVSWDLCVTVRYFSCTGIFVDAWELYTHGKGNILRLQS
jgi:hypothetical protein